MTDEGYDDKLTRDIYFDAGTTMVKCSLRAPDTKRLVFLIDQSRDRSPLARRLERELLPPITEHDGSPLRTTLELAEAIEVHAALTSARATNENVPPTLAQWCDDLSAALGNPTH